MTVRFLLPAFFILLITGHVSAAQPEDEYSLKANIAHLETSINKELHQIRRELTRLRMEQQKPGITEILGGIGYILGIFGTAAYIQAKREKKRQGDSSNSESSEMH